jgi:SAM-dependent methyltransferase
VSLLRRLYDAAIRDRLPRDYAVVQGDIVTRKRRLLDRTRHLPDYERVESDAIREIVEPGDHVVILGAGYGVTTVVASRAAGPSGEVTAYEASPEMVAVAREAVLINETEAPVSLRCRIVGAALSVYGRSTGDLMQPSALPECDVLSMDIEGAEGALVPALEHDGPTLVETHPDACDAETMLRRLPSPVRRRQMDRGSSGADPFLAIGGER